MIILFGAVLGASIGAITARKRDGKPLDIAQYAVGYAIAFGLLGLILTIVIDRLV